MPNETMHRREFARRVAVGAAVPLTAMSGTAATVDDPKPKRAEKPDLEKTEVADPPSQTELLLEVVKQRYPDKRLHETVQNAIRGDLRGDISRSNVLSSFPLNNWDEPGFVFAAYRNDD